MISQASPSTPRLLAVASPNTGTSTPSVAYTRQIRCGLCRTATPRGSVGSVKARRVAAGNMLAATVTGPMAMIATRTWIERSSFVTVDHAMQAAARPTVAGTPHANGFSPRLG